MEGFSQEEKGKLVFHHFMQASAKLIKRPGEVFVDVMASVNVNAFLGHTLLHTYILTLVHNCIAKTAKNYMKQSSRSLNAA